MPVLKLLTSYLLLITYIFSLFAMCVIMSHLSLNHDEIVSHPYPVNTLQRSRRLGLRWSGSKPHRPSGQRFAQIFVTTAISVSLAPRLSGERAGVRGSYPNPCSCDRGARPPRAL